jgi:hypothetical protein
VFSLIVLVGGGNLQKSFSGSKYKGIRLKRLKQKHETKQNRLQ